MPAKASGPFDPRLPRWWWGGLLAGSLVMLSFEAFVTVLPYGSAPPIVHGLVMLAVLAATAAIVRRIDLGRPAFVLGLAAGCVGFAIHGLVDFDLYVPGVMLAFATALALLTSASDASAVTRPAPPFARALTAIFGIVSALAPCGVILFAVTREHVH